MKSYAVVFTYPYEPFSPENSAVYLFETEDKAKHFLEDAIKEHFQMNVGKDDYEVDYYVSKDRTYGWYKEWNLMDISKMEVFLSRVYE
jgi:hypothetical protein